MRRALLTALGVALAAPAAESPAVDLPARAVCDELRAAAAAPRDVDLERAELKKEAAAIEAARQELKTETARLLELVAQTKKHDAGTRAKTPEKPKQQLIGLAKTVSSMKPAKSAAMMVKLPQPLAVSTLEALEPSRRAAILEKMAPDRAAEMLHALSEFKKPSEDGGETQE
jgi:flagellar motility protein MotE (MotC chaperone)